MSTLEKKYTEADMARAQREAAFAGFRSATIEQLAGEQIGTFNSFNAVKVEQALAKRYPMPTVARPRVARDEHGAGTVEWRVVGGKIQHRWYYADRDGEWVELAEDGTRGGGMYINQQRAKMLADLLANPDETVEEEA